MELELVIDTATRAAREAGDIIRSFYGNLKNVRKKGAIDLVTEADEASERAIVDIIGATFPTHGILAEESGRREGDSRFQWIVDPLDGTTNFSHGLGLFAVSIAFFQEGIPRVGIVYNPLSDEFFQAAAGQGATLNGRPIRVSGQGQLGESLLVTGFPYNFSEIMPQLMARFTRCLSVSQGVRRLGSAALDLCFVAAGRFEGFWEQNLNPWDTAAGLLVLQEAGGRATDFSGAPFRVEMKEILATNGRVHEEMLTLMPLDKA
jgi:myo-inositol-1(or 4)-monophosphatase